MEYIIKAKYTVIFEDNKPKILEDTSILVKDDRIVDIGKDIQTSGREVVALSSHVLLPGLINTHTHAAMTLFRGYADDVPLNKWLNEYIWPMEEKLTKEQVKIGAKLAAIEALNFGTTTMNSMYWHPDGEIEAFLEIGARLMSGPPIISGVNTLKDYEYLIDEYHGKDDDFIRITLNPHAPYTVTADQYKQIYEYKNSFNEITDGPKLKIHTHLAESPNDFDQLRKYAKDQEFTFPDVKTTTQYLDSLDILDEDLIVAHAVECSADDIKLLSKKGVGIALNTVSNMKLGNNIVNLHYMMVHKGKIGIGTDGPASNNSLDLIETMKVTSLSQKSKQNNPAIVSAEDMVYLATKGGANVLGWDEIGDISIGKKADLIAIDLNKPHLRPITNDSSIFSNIVYSAKGTDVSDVMVNGVWKKRDGKLQIENIDEIYEEFDKSVHDLLD